MAMLRRSLTSLAVGKKKLSREDATAVASGGGRSPSPLCTSPPSSPSRFHPASSSSPSPSSPSYASSPLGKLRLQKENVPLVQAFRTADWKRFQELLKRKTLKPKQLFAASSPSVSTSSSAEPDTLSSSTSRATLSSSHDALSTSPSSSSSLMVHHAIAPPSSPRSPSSSSSSSSPSSTTTSQPMYYYPNINDYDEHRQTCLHIACTNGSTSLVVDLVSKLGADINVVDDRGWTPLHCALANGHLAAARALLTTGGLNGFHNRINCNIPNESGSTVIHYLARHTTLNEEEEALWEEVFLLLVRMGVKVNETNAHGITPLHDACANGEVFKVKSLVRKGADVNAKNRFGETPLHLAVKSRVMETVQYLLYYGADPHIASEQGTCFELAKLYSPNSGLHTLLAGITSLPDVALLLVCSFMSIKELCTISKVCKTFARISSDDTLWKPIWDQHPRLRSVRIKTDEYSYKELVSDWYRGKWDYWLSTSPISDTAELAANIMLVGDAQVGKSVFLTQFMGRAPKDKLDVNTSMDRTIYMHGKQITLHLYELSMARNTIKGKSPYRGMSGIILFYSSQDVASWTNLARWLEDVRRFSENLPVVIVGTHYDMPAPLVTTAQSRAFAEDKQVMIFESGKGAAHNVQLSLRMIVEAIHNQYAQRSGAQPGVSPLIKGRYYPFQ